MPDPIKDLAKLLPVHSLPKRARLELGLAVVKGKGRPRTVEPIPAVVADDYHAELERQRHAWVEADGVAQAQAEPESSTRDRLYAIELGLAQESAALRWEADRTRNRGADPSQQISRRIDSLCKMAAVLVGRVKVCEPEISDHDLAKVRLMFLESVEAAARETMSEFQAEQFLERVNQEVRVPERGEPRSVPVVL